ncbi:MAG: hypothetical protein HC854_03885 [Flavobacterium sp.]|nr:hypothetical protein [Flavobacterium sp.]
MILNTIIKDIEINRKTLFFLVLGQTYYFLIAFFLFNPNAINLLDELFLLDYKFYLVLFGSFVLSILWFLMNISVSVISLLLPNSNLLNSKSLSEVFVNSMIYSIGYLTLAMLITFLLDYNFKHFIVYSFTFITTRILWRVIKCVTFKKRNFKFF